VKKILFIISLLYINSDASSLKDLIELSEKNPSIQAVQQQTKVYAALLTTAKSSNYPSLDASYNGTFFNEKPVVYLPATFGGGTIQMQSQNTYKGALTLSYPLFSGFAISSQIDAARLQKQRSLLKIDDAKRNLYLNIVKVYSSALTLKYLIESQENTLKATKESYDKAKGFFDEGMNSASELYRMQSMLHRVESELISTKNQYKVLLNQLSFLSNSQVNSLKDLPQIKQLAYEKLKVAALEKRPDLRSMQLMIKEAEAKITLAQSQYYPSVLLFAQAAYSGDTPSLDGDGYTNKNKSVAGFKIKYNLFSGFKDKSQIEVAKTSKLTSEFMMQSYKDRVTTELHNSYLNYQSLLSQRVSAKAELKAQESYEKLVHEQFENQLTDTDVLSRAIASTAMARAFVIQIESKLYDAYAKLLLEVDNETFLVSLDVSH